MIFKLIFKIILRFIMMAAVIGGCIFYVGSRVNGNYQQPQAVVKSFIGKLGQFGNMDNNDNAGNSGGLGNLGGLGSEIGLSDTEKDDKKPSSLEPVKPLLRPDEARNDSISPKDNPSDWDSVESKNLKCWYHKRTRKKICETK